MARKSNIPNLDQHVRLTDFEDSASKILPDSSWNYLQTGAGNGEAAEENRVIWSRVSLVPRILKGVSKPDTTFKLLGRVWAHPIALAPVAAHGAFHPEAELETGLGALNSKSTLIVSTHGSLSLKDFGENHSGPWWFQLYIHRNRDVTKRLVDEACEYGAEAIVLTVDTPVAGYRDQDRKSFVGSVKRLTPGQPDSSYPNLSDLERFEDDLPRHRKTLDPVLDPSISWTDLAWLIDYSRLPIIVKGVLHPNDALEIMNAGAAAIIVSNHGGRNLDGGISALTQLGKIRKAIGSSFPILFDGGITRGSHISKALAMGADAILIGRPYIWGLSTHGALGVQRVVEILLTELETTMILCGNDNLDSITSETIISDL